MQYYQPGKEMSSNDILSNVSVASLQVSVRLPV